jgi:arylsulfatase A-like enzyme
MDLAASITAAAGVTPPADARYEGINLFPILEGRAPEVERTLYWRTNVGNRSMRAVRQGDWKLVVDGNHIMVFNLRQDIGERSDLTAQRQDVAHRLRPLLTDWEQAVDAEALVHEPELAGAAQSGRGRAGGTGGAAGGRGAGAGRGGTAN